MESATNARWYSLVEDVPAPFDDPDHPRLRDLHMEITPFLDGLIDAVRQSGIPIRPIHGARAGHLLGVSISLKVSEELPAINFSARERSPELFSAFYPARRGIGWTVAWPVRQFTVRLQGGNDSEFDYFAIAGVEWKHPTKALAVGAGIPMNFHGAGQVGAVLLLRLNF